MKILKDKVVYLEIQTLVNNEVMEDTNNSGDRFIYLHGHGNILPKLENFLSDKDLGFSGSILVEQDDAFGEYNEDLIVHVEKSNLSDEIPLEIGEMVQFQGPEGMVDLYISSVGKDDVTLDANHYLAGKDLLYKVNVVDIKSAHKDEIKHGRINPVLHNIMVSDSSI